MRAGPWIEGVMFVAGLALASCALQILRQEPTRLHERLAEIVVDEEASLVDVAMDYQR